MFQNFADKEKCFTTQVNIECLGAATIETILRNYPYILRVYPDLVESSLVV